MKDPENQIFVRIVSIDGMCVTVSCTHPGDFEQIGQPPITIGTVEITGRGRSREKGYIMAFSAKSGQSLKSLELNKRYKLSSF